ncbi:hypothetical protein F5879DRAFT_925396 [Lentinula edodes]|nr:hypothetical protein F5879DRAFT_925396 [Lentinula edodes]
MKYEAVSCKRSGGANGRLMALIATASDPGLSVPPVAGCSSTLILSFLLLVMTYIYNVPIRSLVSMEDFISLTVFWQLLNLHAGTSRQKHMFLAKYKWTGANLPVKEYQKGAEFTAFLDYDKHAEAPSRNAALDQIMADNDMITGPMMDKYADALITPYFRQYAVIKQRAATNNLKYTSTYEVPCTAVPVGKDLFAEYYTASQKSSPNFDKLVKLLMQCEPGIGPWQQAVDAENM